MSRRATRCTRARTRRADQVPGGGEKIRTHVFCRSRFQGRRTSRAGWSSLSRGWFGLMRFAFSASTRGLLFSLAARGSSPFPKRGFVHRCFSKDAAYYHLFAFACPVGISRFRWLVRTFRSQGRVRTRSSSLGFLATDYSNRFNRKLVKPPLDVTGPRRSGAENALRTRGGEGEGEGEGEIAHCKRKFATQLRAQTKFTGKEQGGEASLTFYRTIIKAA